MWNINRFQLAKPTGTTPKDKLSITANLLLQQQDAITQAANFTTSSITVGAGKLVVMFIHNENKVIGTAASPASVFGTGLIFKKVKEVVTETGWATLSVWVGCPFSAFTGALSITHGVAKNTCQWSITEFSNTNANSANTGLDAIAQAYADSTGADHISKINPGIFSNFLASKNATVMAFAAQVKAAVTTISVGGSGVTNLVDADLSTGLGWNIHQSLYFSPDPSPSMSIVASGAASPNYIGSISVELIAAPTQHYNLPVSNGTYLYTGSQTIPHHNRRLPADAGGYTYAGQNVSFLYGKALVAATGSYVTSGGNAVLKIGKKLIAAVGSYSYSGTNALLKKGFTLLAGVGSYSYTGMDVSFSIGYKLFEGPDIASFTVTSLTEATFNLFEGHDVAAFSVTATTTLNFDIFEGKDIFSSSVMAGASFTFNLFEGPDIPKFQAFVTKWDRGDAYYINAPYENRTIALTPDEDRYILVPYEDRTIHIQDEWQRIDVDQDRPSRRETT